MRAENERLGTEKSEIEQKFEKLKTKIRDPLTVELDERKAELDEKKTVIRGLQEQIEKNIHERDTLRQELELERRKAKGHKVKDDRLKELVRVKCLLTSPCTVLCKLVAWDSETWSASCSNHVLWLMWGTN